MEDPLGLRKYREMWLIESDCLGDVTVRSKATSCGDATPTTRYRIHVDMVGRSESIDNLSIHQVQDLHTLLGRILEEAS